MYADMTSVQYIHSTRAERRFGRAPVGICVVQALQRARAKCRMALSGADSPGESPEAFGAPAFACHCSTMRLIVEVIITRLSHSGLIVTMSHYEPTMSPLHFHVHT